jgi:hypothetical protein
MLRMPAGRSAARASRYASPCPPRMEDAQDANVCAEMLRETLHERAVLIALQRG